MHAHAQGPSPVPLHIVMNGIVQNVDIHDVTIHHDTVSPCTPQNTKKVRR